MPLGGGLLAAVLHEVIGPAHASLNLDCVELDTASGALRRGPWSLRNLHPSTRLLHQLAPAGAGGCAPAGGLLVISSEGVKLVAPAAAAPSADVAVQQLVAWQLAGLPTAVAAVDGGNGRRLVVADDAAGGWGS